MQAQTREMRRTEAFMVRFCARPSPLYAIVHFWMSGPQTNPVGRAIRSAHVLHGSHSRL
ncbi:hypothetical protein CC79DRAFT_1327241 [Sarocladium strictum]